MHKIYGYNYKTTGYFKTRKAKNFARKLKYLFQLIQLNCLEMQMMLLECKERCYQYNLVPYQQLARH